MAFHPWQFAIGVIVAIAGAVLFVKATEPELCTSRSGNSTSRRKTSDYGRGRTNDGGYEMYHKGKPKERECTVCFETYDDAIHHPVKFIPCKHTCCANCSAGIKVCHLCRGEIESRTLLFNTNVKVE